MDAPSRVSPTMQRTNSTGSNSSADSLTEPASKSTAASQPGASIAAQSEATDAPPVSPVMERSNSFGSNSSAASLTEPGSKSRNGSVPSAASQSGASTAAQSPETRVSLKSFQTPTPQPTSLDVVKSPSFTAETLYGDIVTSFGKSGDGSSTLDNQVSENLPPAPGQMPMSTIIEKCCSCCPCCGGGMLDKAAAACCFPISLLYYAAWVCVKFPKLASKIIQKVSKWNQNGNDGVPVEEQAKSASKREEEPEPKSKSDESFVFPSNSKSGATDEKTEDKPTLKSQHNNPFLPIPDLHDPTLEK